MIHQWLASGVKEAGLIVSIQDMKSLVVYAEELLKWNRKINLTAITDPREVAVKHLIDALFFSQQINSGERLLDIGSGAGIPSIPLKIIMPETDIVSVDAVAKKIHFQRHVSRLLGFKNFEALHMRIEQLNRTEQFSFDVITSRAFSSLEMFVSFAEPLLSKDGRIIAMKGPASDTELSDASGMLTCHGFEISRVIAYELPFKFGTRRLIVIKRCNH